MIRKVGLGDEAQVSFYLSVIPSFRVQRSEHLARAEGREEAKHLATRCLSLCLLSLSCIDFH